MITFPCIHSPWFIFHAIPNKALEVQSRCYGWNEYQKSTKENSEALQRVSLELSASSKSRPKSCEDTFAQSTVDLHKQRKITKPHHELRDGIVLIEPDQGHSDQKWVDKNKIKI
jgi:hypothetical protein